MPSRGGLLCDQLVWRRVFLIGDTHELCAKIIDAGRADQLRHHQPKDIRAAILGSECPQNLIMVDVHWTDRPIDAQVEDLIVLPPGTCLEGCCIRVLERSPRGTLAQSAAPGNRPGAPSST